MRAIWLGSFLTDTIYLAAGAWTARFVGSPLQQALARWRYGALAPHYDQDVLPQADYLAPLEAALDRLPEAPARALDVSTGTGAAVESVVRRFPRCTGTAVDLSPAMLGHAVRRAQRAGLPVQFAASNAARLPFPTGAFDLVTVQNAFPVPRELVRVTRPGGWIIMAYSAGGSVLPWIVRSMTRQLGSLGCDPVETSKVAAGRYFMARRSGMEAPQ